MELRNKLLALILCVIMLLTTALGVLAVDGDTTGSYYDDTESVDSSFDDDYLDDLIAEEEYVDPTACSCGSELPLYEHDDSCTRKQYITDMLKADGRYLSAQAAFDLLATLNFADGKDFLVMYEDKVPTSYDLLRDLIGTTPDGTATVDVDGNTVSLSGIADGAEADAFVAGFAALEWMAINDIAGYLTGGRELAFSYDITVSTADSDNWQPSVGTYVTVTVDVDEKYEGMQIGILHEHDGSIDDLGIYTVTDGTISFETDGFSSFYGYTVDFLYDGTWYSIPGGSSITLSELFGCMGITRSVTEVATVEFTDPTLIAVDTYIESDYDPDTETGGEYTDYTLTSLAAFDTEEFLTVTFTDGSVVTINVYDAATEISGITSDITIKRTSNANKDVYRVNKDLYIRSNITIKFVDDSSITDDYKRANLCFKNGGRIIVNTGRTLTIIKEDGDFDAWIYRDTGHIAAMFVVEIGGTLIIKTDDNTIAKSDTDVRTICFGGGGPNFKYAKAGDQAYMPTDAMIRVKGDNIYNGTNDEYKMLTKEKAQIKANQRDSTQGKTSTLILKNVEFRNIYSAGNPRIVYDAEGNATGVEDAGNIYGGAIVTKNTLNSLQYKVADEEYAVLQSIQEDFYRTDLTIEGCYFHDLYSRSGPVLYLLRSMGGNVIFKNNTVDSCCSISEVGIRSNPANNNKNEIMSVTSGGAIRTNGGCSAQINVEGCKFTNNRAGFADNRLDVVNEPSTSSTCSGRYVRVEIELTEKVIIALNEIQILDANGNNLASGKKYKYENNTSLVFNTGQWADTTETTYLAGKLTDSNGTDSTYSTVYRDHSYTVEMCLGDNINNRSTGTIKILFDLGSSKNVDSVKIYAAFRSDRNKDSRGFPGYIRVYVGDSNSFTGSNNYLKTTAYSYWTGGNGRIYTIGKTTADFEAVDINSQCSGAAIYWNGGGTDPISNKPGKMTINKCNFTDNWAAYRGGACYLEADTEITYTTFEGNKATGCRKNGTWRGGGAIALFSYGGGNMNGFKTDFTLTLDKTVKFINNSADEGGAIRYNISYTANKASDVKFDLIIDGAYFEGNSTIENEYSDGYTNNWGRGGAIFCFVEPNALYDDETNPKDIKRYYNATLHLNSGTFKNNTALEGGAINVRNFNVTIGTEVQTENLLEMFDNNATKSDGNNGRGGAIFINQGDDVTQRKEHQTVDIFNCYIHDNTAQNKGGAIYIQQNATSNDPNLALDVTIAGGTITGNTASADGGGIYAISDVDGQLNVNMTGGDITNNTATTNGGGIFTSVKNGSFSYGDNAKISGNSAVNGGGVYVNAGIMNVTNGIISHNIASSSGGGVYVNAGKFKLSGENIGLYSNTATTCADDLYSTGVTTTVILPSVGQMNLAGWSSGAKPTGWFADYADDDNRYPKEILVKENNGRYRYPKYKDAVVEVKYATLSSNTTAYYNLTLGIPPETSGQVTIVKTVDKAPTEDQIFLFKLSGHKLSDTDQDDGELSIIVAVTVEKGQTQGKTVLLTVPKGKYTVEELGSWSWRYTKNGNAVYMLNGNSVDGDGNTYTEIAMGRDQTNWTVTFSNKLETENWLSHDVYNRNLFNQKAVAAN